MTLIIMNNEDLLDIPSLLRLALKKIYDKKHFTFNEDRQLQKTIIAWSDYLCNKKGTNVTGLLSATDEESQMGLEIIGGLLQQDENGEFNGRKELFRRHNIDYRKFHRLPEAYKAKDFQEGQYHLREHMKNNPEDYK